MRHAVVARPALTRARPTAAWRSDALAVAVLLGVIGLSLAPGLVLRQVPAERDTGVFYYPLAMWVSSQLRGASELPLWAPQVFSGYPIFADGEIGLASPIVLFTLWALPVDLAFVVLRFIHLAIAAVGCYALARVWRLPPMPATLAGITFALGSFLQAQIHHENIIRTAVWLPLMVALLECSFRARGRARWRWTILAGLVVGLAGLGLHIQLFAMDLLVLGIYGLLRWLLVRDQPTVARWRSLLLMGGAGLVAVVLGLLLAAVQIVPLAELAQNSLRGSGIPYPDAAAYSLTPYGLAQLLFPFFFRGADMKQWGLWTHWESYLYVGVVPLVLSVLALQRVRQRGVLLWTVLGVVGVLLALGQYSLLNLHYLLWLLPGMNGLRAPGRFALLAVLAMAMLAAIGLDWLLVQACQAAPISAKRRGRLLLVAGFLPGLLAVSLAAIHFALLAWPNTFNAWANAFYLSLPRDSYSLTAQDVARGLLWSTDLLNPSTGLAVLGLAFLLGTLVAWRGVRSDRWRTSSLWPSVLVVATVADLIVFGWRIHPLEPLTKFSTPPPAVDAIRALIAQQPATEGPVRVSASPILDQVAPNRLAPFGLQEANGYTSLESRWHRDLMQRVLSVDDDLLDLWNVRYLIEPSRYGALPTYKQVQYLPQQTLLRAPTDSVLGDELFRVPADFAVGEIRLVSALVDAVDVPQGTVAGQLILRDAAGAVVGQGQIVAGRDVMEWASLDPSLPEPVQHQPVEVAGSTTERLGNGQSAQRSLSYGAVRLDHPVPAATLEIRNVLPHGELAVYGAALVNPSGGVSQLFGRTKVKYQEVYRDQDLTVLENTSAFPRAFLVPSAHVAAQPGSSLDLMANGPFDPHQEVILAPETPTAAANNLPLSDQTATIGSATIESYTPDLITLQTTSTQDGYLVLSDAYYPGWQATVDGVAQPIYRGDMLFRVVPIAAGTHAVVMTFQAPTIELGLLISAAALAAALIGLGLLTWPLPWPAVRRSRFAPAPASAPRLSA